MQFRRRYQRRSYIDITPMIDIVFNLLLFFIVITFMNYRQSINIALPEAREGQSEAAPERVEITIDRNGNYFSGKVPIPPENLINTLILKKNEAREDGGLYILADTATQHGFVVNLMDKAKQVGFAKLSIATKKE